MVSIIYHYENDIKYKMGHHPILFIMDTIKKMNNKNIGGYERSHKSRQLSICLHIFY